MRWIVVLVLALAATADAHPTGHTFSSSGSGGAGAAVFVAILIGGGFAFAILFIAVSGYKARGWDSARMRPQPPLRLDLTPLLAADPDFSRPVFEDFVYHLYAAAQRARHDPAALAKLAPYLSPTAMAKLASRGRVEKVVIGSLRILAVDAAKTRVTVSIEANLARSDGGTLDATERWAFVRSTGAATKPPIGASLDWTVENIWVDAEVGAGRTLTGTVEEIGNNFPTLEDADAQMLLMRLRNDDPNVTWDALTAHVKTIYERLQQAWNTQDVAPVRALVTPSMLAYMQFWIDEYKRQRFANKLDDATIQHIALAKTTRDKVYDAITVRVFAIGLDYTLDADGKVVGGSRDVRREYTEYWTLLRAQAQRGPIETWLLSKIEQDDVYRG